MLIIVIVINILIEKPGGGGRCHITSVHTNTYVGTETSFVVLKGSFAGFGSVPSLKRAIINND